MLPEWLGWQSIRMPSSVRRVAGWVANSFPRLGEIRILTEENILHCYPTKWPCLSANAGG